MGKPDVIYEIRDCRDTGYRIEPNPDAEPGCGFKFGATIMHDGDGRGMWVESSSFFIAPESMEAVGLALIEAAKDYKP